MSRTALSFALASILLAFCEIATAGNIFDAVLIGNAQEVAKFVSANPKLVHARTELGSTPLHIAATLSSPDAAKSLIAKGADVSARDNNGATPLHLAAYTGKKEVAELLLNSGAIADAKDDKNATPLNYAERVPSNETKPVLVLWLLKHPSVKSTRKN